MKLNKILLTSLAVTGIIPVATISACASQEVVTPAKEFKLTYSKCLSTETTKVVEGQDFKASFARVTPYEIKNWYDMNVTVNGKILSFDQYTWKRNYDATVKEYTLTIPGEFVKGNINVTMVADRPYDIHVINESSDYPDIPISCQESVFTKDGKFTISVNPRYMPSYHVQHINSIIINNKTLETDQDPVHDQYIYSGNDSSISVQIYSKYITDDIYVHVDIIEW